MNSKRILVVSALIALMIAGAGLALYKESTPIPRHLGYDIKDPPLARWV